MRIWLVLVVFGLLAVATSYVWHGFAFWAGTDTTFLGAAAGADGARHRLGLPLRRRLAARPAADPPAPAPPRVVGVNGVLCFTVAGALLFGAHLVGVQRDFIITMFGDGAAVGAHHGRYNVLLLGGDSGAGRWGLRPDSMTVASIDAETGKTVLIGLPRNMANFPFAEGSVMDEQFPDGFDCEGCYLNGVSTWAGDNTELFPGSKNPGVDATIMGVEGITGLKINYWAMVNLEGFKDLVDAVGGVTLNVRQPIPVGLPHEETYRLHRARHPQADGHDTLWFARAREGSDDYSRMARQKCVMNAMLQQISPQTALRNFEKIADASSAMVSTDIPRSEVDRFVDLALKARSQKISTLSLVPPMINTADPDIELVQAKVQAAIDRSEGIKPAPATDRGGCRRDPGRTRHQRGSERDAQRSSETPSETPTQAPVAPPSVTGGSLGSMAEGYAANESEDLGAVC